MIHTVPDRQTFDALAAEPGATRIPVTCRLFADALTPVLAYRRLVSGDDRAAPSFLFESVVDGDRIGRYSYLGARPTIELIARRNWVELRHHCDPAQSRTFEHDDPLEVLQELSRGAAGSHAEGLPEFTGGWVGYAAYDAVRYVEPEKLNDPPEDDRGLPDLHMQRYDEVVVFDHVQKSVVLIAHADFGESAKPQAAYEEAVVRLEALAQSLMKASQHVESHLLSPATGAIDLSTPPPRLPPSNMGEGGYATAVERVREYVKAGDAFQVVPSQRFELTTHADPFDIYRALRVVNPSPYMFYLQIDGGMLVGSSPEILCRVREGELVNRPLAGTRHRGKTEAEDAALADDLLADPKDRAEHIMLVDLGRNDVGRVANPGTIDLPRIMQIERYSHVMHISSTVTGKLRDGADCWDALRATLPVGTVSGAPKVRAMQIIDELEPTRRGPYAGAVGYADFAGNMDMAIALRTMVVMPADSGKWTVHVQAGAGIVYDSDPQAEHVETLNKAAALAKAVDVAERAFGE